MKQHDEGVELNLSELFRFIKKKAWIIAIVLLICILLSAVFTLAFTEPTYTAATRIYVLNRASDSLISSSDYNVSAYMANDYRVLITGKNVTQKVVEQLDLDMTITELTQKISVDFVSNTRVLEISVTHTDPEQAAQIANCVREVASLQIKQIMDVDAINLIYEASVPTSKGGVSLTTNILRAVLAGLVVSVGILVVVFRLDDTLRNEEDVEHYLGLSVLGAIPESKELGGDNNAPLKHKIFSGIF